MLSTLKVKSYHHGDLRAELVRTGLRLLAERNTDDLSLREMAREVGVSANAVYRHFPDKAALMRALSTEGLHELAEAQRAAAKTAGGGAIGFAATGRAYVEFAIANPALFRLIFSNPANADLLTPPDGDQPDVMAFLRANAEEVAGTRGDAKVIALRAWSLAHGLAMLILDKQATPDEDTIRRLFATLSDYNMPLRLAAATTNEIDSGTRSPLPGDSDKSLEARHRAL